MGYTCDCGRSFSDSAGVEACQIGNHGDPHALDWKPFGKKALNGVFWVCGKYPEYDVDCNDYGETVGRPTGETIKFVALVEIDYEPPFLFDVEPVNRCATGDFRDDEYRITHYAPFEMPKGM